MIFFYHLPGPAGGSWAYLFKKHSKTKSMTDFFSCRVLKKGIERGELNEVPVTENVTLLITMINGLLRQYGLKLEHMAGLKEVAVEF